jgi:hypothetical protein
MERPSRSLGARTKDAALEAPASRPMSAGSPVACLGFLPRTSSLSPSPPLPATPKYTDLRPTQPVPVSPTASKRAHSHSDHEDEGLATRSLRPNLSAPHARTPQKTTLSP